MKITSTNPSRNYEVIGEVEASAQQEIIDAVAKARAAQPAWSALSQAERNKAVQSFLDVCAKHTDEIATLMSREMGKPIKDARAGGVSDFFDYFQGYMASVEDTSNQRLFLKMRRNATISFANRLASLLVLRLGISHS